MLSSLSNPFPYPHTLTFLWYLFFRLFTQLYKVTVYLGLPKKVTSFHCEWEWHKLQCRCAILAAGWHASSYVVLMLHISFCCFCSVSGKQGGFPIQFQHYMTIYARESEHKQYASSVYWSALPYISLNLVGKDNAWVVLLVLSGFPARHNSSKTGHKYIILFFLKRLFFFLITARNYSF